jgi:DNA-binding transcriptional LysR family regulator
LAETEPFSLVEPRRAQAGVVAEARRSHHKAVVLLTVVVLAEGFATDVITRMAQRYPRVTFQLTAEESGSIYRALEERKLDLAIARIFEPVPEHLKSEALYDDRHVVAAGARSPLSGRRRIRLADLMNEPWVLPPLETLLALSSEKPFAPHVSRFLLQQSSPRRPLHASRLSQADGFCPSSRLPHCRLPARSQHQGLANRFDNTPKAERHRHLETPRTQPGSAALRRLRSRPC